jgi:hypothetical protein
MHDVQDQKETIKTMVLAWASKANAAPSEEDLSVAIMGLAPIFGAALSNADIQSLKDNITRVFAIRMDMGVVIEAKDHKEWVQARQATTDWALWGAYSQFMLNDGRPPVVIDKLNSSLDLILDHLGDPEEMGSWKRRGLVIGDVQSGKTGTYIGLMDKAADVGYRMFIVLTGNTESLRQQTQSRVDEGMLGQDSKPLSKVKAQISNKPSAIGVGLLAELQNSIASMTTMTTDFRKAGLEATSFRPAADTLMVFVTKKNATVLKNIAEWLGRQATIDGKIPVPLLFLDDEADYASVNTNRPETDPTAINAAIKTILAKFSRSSYVGFTATPFANIFIDDEIEDDLFPHDFIYGLDAPTNYVGPRSLFGDATEPVADDVVREIDDAQDSFPFGHQNGHYVEALPDSLIEALQTFLLANAIRDLQGHSRSSRSMLVNVSRFNSVQGQIGVLIENELAGYRNAIRLHASSYALGTHNTELATLEETFSKEFSSGEWSWEQVLGSLPAAVAEIEVRVMNSRRDREYEERQLRAENPPRTIAVGGDLLSRGLTLEGLMTSYFYRRVAASDTLMQMARWFGYRDGYAALTRVWITPDLVADYASTADSLGELRSELLRMRDQGLTPTQYGLAVKNHPSALLITARNKMRAAALGKKAISLRGRAIETHKVSAGSTAIAENLRALEALTTELHDSCFATEERSPTRERLSWRNVDKSFVSHFLHDYKAPSGLALFSQDTLARFVKDATAEDLQSWDVVVVGGSGSKTIELAGVSLKRAVRAVGSGDGTYLISGSKQRVAGTGDVAALLSKERKDMASDSFRRAGNADTKSVPDREYVRYLERPLLLVYPIEATLQPTKTEREAESTGLPAAPLPFTLVGAVIAIPERIGAEESGPAPRDTSGDVVYTLNVAAQRLWVPEIFDEDDDDD